MAGQLFPMCRFQALNDGVTVPAAKLYFYGAGTDVAKNTYNDPDLAIGHLNANPVVCDSAGLAGAIYLLPAAYKVVLKTSGDVTIWTQDNVQGRADTSTAHAFSVRRTSNQTITTATPTNVQFNVEDLDTDAQFDAVSDFRFEPTTDGSIWEFHVSMSVASMTGTFSVFISTSQGGGAYLATDSRVLTAEAGTITLSAVNTTAFTSGDYITVSVSHDHGSDKTVTGRWTGKQIGIV